MGQQRVEASSRAWAARYDRAAGELIDETVLAAGQFLRPRGWRAFGCALTGAPVGLARRARGRPRQMRLPQTLLVAVTAERIHLLSARWEPGHGPVPHPTGTLAVWERAAVTVAATALTAGTQLTITAHGGGRVQLYGPPDALTARLVDVLLMPAPLAAAGMLAAAPSPPVVAQRTVAA